eukprot:jgi/Ulvmu1/8304/UM042_0009.1
MAAKAAVAHLAACFSVPTLLCRSATSGLQWLPPAQNSLYANARHCSTSVGDSQDTQDQEAPARQQDATTKKSGKNLGVLLKGGPRSMIREDVMDIFARHNLQIPPESVTPLYYTRSGEGFIQFGWAVQCVSHSQVSRALRISRDKVGPHRVSVEEYTLQETQLRVLQQALKSYGRYLLVQNLPQEVTYRDLIQAFRGFRLLEGDSTGPVIMVGDAPSRDRGGRGDRSGHREARPGRGDRRGRGGDEANLPRAAIVKMTTPEDAHAAWRLRHGRRYSFARGADGPAPKLSCKILE